MSRFDDENFKQLQLNVKFNVIPKTRLKKFGQLFTGYPTGLVKSEPGGFVMPPPYGENAEKIYRMKPRSDDVWLLTFPKCGKSNTKSSDVNSISLLYLSTILFHRDHLDFRIAVVIEK
jgi:hypothetical protein